MKQGVQALVLVPQVLRVDGEDLRRQPRTNFVAAYVFGRIL